MVLVRWLLAKWLSCKHDELTWIPNVPCEKQGIAECTNNPCGVKIRVEDSWVFLASQVFQTGKLQVWWKSVSKNNAESIWRRHLMLTPFSSYTVPCLVYAHLCIHMYMLFPSDYNLYHDNPDRRQNEGPCNFNVTDKPSCHQEHPHICYTNYSWQCFFYVFVFPFQCTSFLSMWRIAYKNAYKPVSLRSWSGLLNCIVFFMSQA